MSALKEIAHPCQKKEVTMRLYLLSETVEPSRRIGIGKFITR
jgi:hypothetical protein